MCRHLAYLGPPRSLAELLTTPPHSLYEQAWAPRHQAGGTVNADGFGIGWYPPGDGAGPVRYRRAVPVWADANLPGLAGLLHSGAVLAAVRSATPGCGLDESASAPFALGRWLFSLNGRIDRWEQLPADLGEVPTPAELLGIEGRCDAALVWLLLARRLVAGEPAGAALAELVSRIAAVRPAARLNLLLTDGHTVTATRHGDSLWYRTPDDASPAEAPAGDAGPAGQGQPDAGSADAGLVVASEPVPGQPGWREVPDHSLLRASRTSATVEPLPPHATGPPPQPAP
ncbi:ergothioneine biosynthesis protein EgtC [Streptomyces sp. 3MP-14]|uniref:Gamma-glutamyl-hercynylcysteine sulfoxide hydrolase n=1 Tax=Streptomyces mimosae TaxID=2586635 RepID=A0A5N6A9T9_9ACTN|nr:MULTISPECIES: ergothioneine biosynthesis protein EgtC [Streptomyces]KAB8164268.1 ergothioneine biosynthesis protein EgtC [Streptomyces mimosae]KAB8176545.1 ergothioneine biosynthesis protein EgtC [Streptomyces sp. 3MP-14]